MQEQLQSRLDALRKEFEIGQAELQKIENQRIYLHETMLRIGGAIQVLEELLAEGKPAGQNEICLDEAQAAASRTDETNV
jgi:hypothetical protein